MPSARYSERSGWRVRVGRPWYGSAYSHQSLPSESRSGSTSNTNLPITSGGSSAVSLAATRLNTTIRPTSSATTTPSGSSSAKTRLPIGTGPSGSGLTCGCAGVTC